MARLHRSQESAFLTQRPDESKRILPDLGTIRHDNTQLVVTPPIEICL